MSTLNKINNCKELWGSIVGDHDLNESQAETAMHKSVFKYTECGCSFMSNESGVFVSGYAEGSDGELPVHDLKWGFTMEEYNAALGEADKEGVEEWHTANGENYED